MSVAEKLGALAEEPVRNMFKLGDALPQIVAVVKAVEQLQLREFESGVWYDVYESLPATLAALDDAL